MSATIQQALSFATQALADFLPEAQLDAELLLAYALKKERSYLHAWPEKKLSSTDLMQFQDYLRRRLKYEPLAYITGEKEFWSLSLCVNQHVLIPRPETELVIEKVLELLPNNSSTRIADLGTGSGAIAIALAHERPEWEICATDICQHALNLAQYNAERIAVKNINFAQGDWCRALPLTPFDAIISNPPYISETEWEGVSSSLSFEPKKALYADENGLQAYIAITQAVKAYLKPNGYLFLEHGNDQAVALQQILLKAGLQPLPVLLDLAGHPRITIAINTQL